MSVKSVKQADPVMTLEEVAKYLKVSEKTVLRMVRAKQFPGVKVSNQWRFVRAIVDDWLSAQTYPKPKRSLVHAFVSGEPPFPLTQLISRHRIILDVKPGAKAAVLNQLVKPLREGGLVADERDYLKRLLAREEVVSTAIGHGFAIPHVRKPSETRIPMPCIVFGVCRQGTDFGALDGQKTFVFAMPCAGSEASHLYLLAKLSLVFRKPDVIKKIAAARTKDAVMETLTAADQDALNRENWRNSLKKTDAGEIQK